MHIHELPLHCRTLSRCGAATIGARVAATGAECLWSERPSAVIDVVVIHAMSAVGRFPDDPYRIENIVSIFCEYGVSSHYVVSRRGGIFRFVPEIFKAWHCGGSIMPEPDCRRNVNDFSIGIELLATAESGFTSSQYQAVARLCAHMERQAGKQLTYVGHEHVAGARAVELGLRQEPKTDPGPLFDWHIFRNLLDRQRLHTPTSC